MYNFQALDYLNGPLLSFGDRAMKSYTHVLSPASEEQGPLLCQLPQLGICVSLYRARFWLFFFTFFLFFN